MEIPNLWHTQFLAFIPKGALSHMLWISVLIGGWVSMEILQRGRQEQAGVRFSNTRWHHLHYENHFFCYGAIFCWLIEIKKGKYDLCRE